MNLPAQLPDIQSAKLPSVYEHARTALAECERVDECKAWSDKAAALASYARQANDDTLLKTAMRIQGRATRRAGELLKEIDTASGARTDLRQAPTRGSAAADAGLSEHQAKTAVRVANVPADEFEKAVESDTPPTVTKLAEMGKKPRPPKVIDHLDGRDPKDFALATQALGLLQSSAAKLRDIDPAAVVRGSSPDEHLDAASDTQTLIDWLTRFKRELEQSNGVQQQRPDDG